MSNIQCSNPAFVGTETILMEKAGQEGRLRSLIRHGTTLPPDLHRVGQATQIDIRCSEYRVSNFTEEANQAHSKSPCTISYLLRSHCPRLLLPGVVMQCVLAHPQLEDAHLLSITHLCTCSASDPDVEDAPADMESISPRVNKDFVPAVLLTPLSIYLHPRPISRQTAFYSPTQPSI